VLGGAKHTAAAATVAGSNSTRSALIGGNVTCWGDDKFGRSVHGARV
jgi:hypothetical protein